MVASPSSMPAPAPRPAPTSSMGAIGSNFFDRLTSAIQGTSPQLTSITGKPNYTLAPPEEQWKYQEIGVPSDQQKYVAIGDQVYNRNPNMDQGWLGRVGSGFGNLLSLALPSEAPAVGIAKAATPSQNLLQDFNQSGVTPSLPAVGQNRVAGLMSQIANSLPFVGGPVRAAAGQTISDTANAAQRIADTYGQASTPLDAGDALQKSLRQYITNSGNQASTLYDTFNAQMAAAPPAQLPNTLAAMAGPVARFPTSPALGAALTNPKLQSFLNILQPAGSTAPATLTFPELSELRTYTGNALGDATLVNDIPRADLKNLYSSISSDMENAAQAQGPNAMFAFQQATAFYRNRMNTIDALDPLLNGPPETAFARVNRAASPGSSGNIGLPQTAQAAMPPEDWRNVGAAIIRQMGQPPAGAKNALAPDAFSAPSFATNWNKLSDDAKDTLFGPNPSGPVFGPMAPGTDRAALDALTRVAQAQKNVASLANTSHSAEYGLIGLGAAKILDDPALLFSHPLTAIGSALGSNLMSRFLMSPGVARWVYALPGAIARAPTPMVGAQQALAGLGNLAKMVPAIAPAYNVLNQPPSPPSVPPP
jgi:hypothetical protein